MKVTMPIWAFVVFGIAMGCYGVLGYHYGLVDSEEIYWVWVYGLGSFFSPLLVGLYQKFKLKAKVTLKSCYCPWHGLPSWYGMKKKTKCDCTKDCPECTL